MKISNTEKKEFSKRFPYLKFVWTHTLEWNLFFDSYYDNISNEFYPYIELAREQIWHLDEKYCIGKSQYEIRILMPKNHKFVEVEEIWGKLESVCKEKNIRNIADLHVHSETNRLCLCGEGTKERYIKQWLTLPIIMNNLIIPYFYAQKYYELYDERPWGELAHWEEGCKQEFQEQLYQYDIKWETIEPYWDTLKTYIDTLSKKKAKPKWHHECICGSRLKFRECHNNLFTRIREIL